MSCSYSCLILAGDSRQKSVAEDFVARRRSAGLYPREIPIRVVADPETGRLGSGGSLVSALSQAGSLGLAPDGRVLVILAGGERRAMPTFAPEGTLFAPLPLSSSSTFPPVLLDSILTLFVRYPWRDGEVVVASGDVFVDLDTDGVPGGRGDVCGFAVPASLEQASRHGVFGLDRNRENVVDYWQKASADFLRAHACLPGTLLCAQDTGIVAFSGRGVAALREVGRGLLRDGASAGQAPAAGGLRFDLYLEVLTACIKGMTWERYTERMGGHSALPRTVLRRLFHAFQEIDMGVSLTDRAAFAHVGTLDGFAESCLTVARRGAAPFYQPSGAEIEPEIARTVVLTGCADVVVEGAPAAGAAYLEGCANVRIRGLEGGNLLSCLRDCDIPFSLPAGICLDARPSSSREIVLVYGCDDTWTPRTSLGEAVFCCTPLDEWHTQRSLSAEEVVVPRSDGTWDLCDARLFLPGVDMAFARGYWDAGCVDEAWTTRFRGAPRMSLAEVNASSDARARDERRRVVRRLLLRKSILAGRAWRTVSRTEFAELFGPDDLPTLEGLCARSEDDLLAVYRRRVLSSLGPAAGDGIAALTVSYVTPFSADRLSRGVRQDQIVCARCPVRLDIAGGWTDTPPFTLREGGEVVNVAVDLGGQPPIQVFCRPTQERMISLRSIDLGEGELIREFPAPENRARPDSPFVLPKAALCLLGLSATGTGLRSLAAALDRIGCGVEITLLCAVPKGSGLGTSSILGGAILGALSRFFGLTIAPEELFRMVLQMEQMLTTGGGWQDQIGGLVGGVKYIRTAPGLRPEPVVHQLDDHVFTDRSSRELFTLFYTGSTRLAKNILQEVVDKANGMSPAYLYTLRSLKGLAVEAREAISVRDVRRLAAVVHGSWEANKLIHPSTTNAEVDGMLAALRPLYRGAKLLGAGGGGYALFVSETAREADQLRSALREGYENDRARLVDMSLNQRGLEVTVS